MTQLAKEILVPCLEINCDIRLNILHMRNKNRISVDFQLMMPAGGHSCALRIASPLWKHPRQGMKTSANEILHREY